MTPMDCKKNEIKIYQGKKEKIEEYKQNSINRMNNVNLKYDNEIAKLQEDINEAIKFKEKVTKEYKRNKIIYTVASVLLLNPLPLLMLKPTKRKLEYAIKSLEEYLLELQSCESIKDQQEWQEIMKEEINYANSLIPRTI